MGWLARMDGWVINMWVKDKIKDNQTNPPTKLRGLRDK